MNKPVEENNSVQNNGSPVTGEGEPSEVLQNQDTKSVQVAVPSDENKTQEEAETTENLDKTDKTDKKLEEEVDKKDKKNNKTEKEDSEKSKNSKKWYEKLPRLVHRHILFFITCALTIFVIIWVWANAYQSMKAGTNDNLFHEFLVIFLGGLFILWTYKRIYKKSKVYKTKEEEWAAKKKEQERIKREKEAGKKHKVFIKIINNFKSAKSYKEKSIAITKLLSVGLGSPKLRQQVIDILTAENEWMREHTLFLQLQNLVTWRLRKDLFPSSDRFQEGTEVQDMSIKSINIIEAIIKKHLIEFKEQLTDITLDLTDKVLPTLTLTAQFIPAGSVIFDNAILWKSSFSETVIDRISFQEADLYGSSFWRAKIRKVDFEGANLKKAKFRTNIQEARNITAKQFFGTKDWELCFISFEQSHLFFEETEDPGDKHFSRWSSGKPRRDKLYFNIQQR